MQFFLKSHSDKLLQMQFFTRHRLNNRTILNVEFFKMRDNYSNLMRIQTLKMKITELQLVLTDFLGKNALSHLQLILLD